MQERLQYLTNIRNIESYRRPSVSAREPFVKGKITYLNTQAVIDDLAKNREPVVLDRKSIAETYGLSSAVKDAISSGQTIIAKPDGSVVIPEYQRANNARADYLDIQEHNSKRPEKSEPLQPEGIIYYSPEAAQKDAVKRNNVVIINKKNMLPGGISQLSVETRLAVERGESATVTPDGSIHAQQEELICSF